MRLKDKVVLITGGSRGVGAACAIACAKEGANLVLAAKTVEPHPKLPGTLGEVADAVKAEGQDALAIQVDVRYPEQIEAMIEQTISHYGRLDVVINNAGAIHWSPLADWSLKKYDLVMNVNVRASFLTSRLAIPHLRKNGGHILMMSPPIHPESVVGKAPYILSKIGMTMLAMAIDAEEEKIAAHALWPVTGVRTAATVNLGMGEDKDWRTPEILSDATLALITKDPKTSKFRAWLDEEVLKAEGVTDFTKYRCDPSFEPSPTSILLVNPNYKPED